MAPFHAGAYTLLLERLLGQKLQGDRRSPQAVIETLATCHLNQYRGAGDTDLPLYSLTEATDEQLKILRKLRMPLLADNDDVATHVVPRAA